MWYNNTRNKGEQKMNNKLKGIIYMLISSVAFSGMQIMIAKTADTVPLFEQLFFRNFVVLIIASLEVRKHHAKFFGHKGSRKMLFLRSGTGFLGMITMFYAAANAPQADVTILAKLSPFVVSVLAVLFLKEKFTKYQAIGLVVAFVGVCFVANPKFTADIFPLVVALISAFFAGIAYTAISALKGREHPSTIVFFFSAVSTVISFFIIIVDFVPVSLVDMFQLLLLSIFAAVGQLGLTKAYSITKASEVSIYSYSSVAFSTVFAAIFLSQAISLHSVLGSSLVILASLIVYFGNRHLEKKKEIDDDK